MEDALQAISKYSLLVCAFEIGRNPDNVCCRITFQLAAYKDDSTLKRAREQQAALELFSNLAVQNAHSNSEIKIV